VLSAEGPATEYATGPVIANVTPGVADIIITRTRHSSFTMLVGGNKALYITQLHCLTGK
jgi:hypothetical protein